MKRIFYNEDFFKLLRQLDYQKTNDNIGLAIKDEMISSEDFQQIYSNQWHKKNNYFLVFGDINKNTINSFINSIKYPDLIKGLCIDCTTQTKILMNLIENTRKLGIPLYMARDKMSDDQLNIIEIRQVDTIYDI